MGLEKFNMGVLSRVVKNLSKINNIPEKEIWDRITNSLKEEGDYFV